MGKLVIFIPNAPKEQSGNILVGDQSCLSSFGGLRQMFPCLQRSFSHPSQCCHRAEWEFPDWQSELPVEFWRAEMVASMTAEGLWISSPLHCLDT